MIFYGKKFKELRRKKHISINYLASELKISRRTIWLWENQKSIPIEKYIRMLSKATGIPVSLISDLKDELPVSNLKLDELISNKGEDIDSKNDVSKRYDILISELYSLQNKERQNSVLLDAFINSVSAIFYVKDTNLNYVAVNSHFIKEYSISPPQSIRNKNDAAFFSRKEAIENSSEDESVIISGAPIVNVERPIPGTNKRKWGMISKYPILDSNKKIVGLVGTFIDITEKKRDERKKELLDIYVNAMNEGISIINRNKQTYEYINKAKSELYGVEIKDFINNGIYYTLERSVHPEDLEYVRKQMDLCVCSKTRRSVIEFRINNPMKGLRWIQCSMSHKNYMNFNCIICIEKDITISRQIESFSSIYELNVDYIPDPVLIRKMNTPGFFYINEAAKAFYDAEKLQNGGIDFWIDKCVTAGSRKEISDSYQNGFKSKCICRVRNAKGEIRIVEILPAIKTNINNEEYNIYIHRDITDSIDHNRQ